jgi:hypothetical protein
LHQWNVSYAAIHGSDAPTITTRSTIDKPFYARDAARSVVILIFFVVLVLVTLFVLVRALMMNLLAIRLGPRGSIRTKPKL